MPPRKKGAMEDGRLSLLLGVAITPSIRSFGLLTAAAGLTIALTGCGDGKNADAVARAAMALRRVGSYKASYQVVTRLEGADRPITGAGLLEFRFPDRSRQIGGDLEVIAVGAQVWSRMGGRWRQESLATPSLEPHLYLAAAKEVRKVGEQRYTFRLDRAGYRRALEGQIGALPQEVAEALSSFDAEGEVTLGYDGLPGQMSLRTKRLAPGRGVQITEATFRFLEFGADYDIRPPGQEG